ncbi:MAG: VWA domain-containing protein [Oscillospiraceae bacterium]|nr:VWA domain-containing protein [Oscillospiraceae bacterium]
MKKGHGENMKKLLLIALLIFSLLIGACASENNTAETGGNDNSTDPAPIESDSGLRNFTGAADSFESAGDDSTDSVSFSSGDFYEGVPPSDAGAAGDAAAPAEPERVSGTAVSDSAPDESPRGGDGELSALSPPTPAVDMLWSSDTDGEYYGEMPFAPAFSVTQQQPSLIPQAGLLTAGEWNDNRNWSFWSNLMGQNEQFREFAGHWQLFAANRTVVKVVDENNNPVRGAEVILTNTQFKAITDHEGMAYVFRGFGSFPDNNSPTTITVNVNGETQVSVSESETTFVFEGAGSPAQLKLDLMFVIDTTGSMGDELHYLQTELDDVINNVSRNNANLPIRLSVNFYRDKGDEYVVRPFTFSTDIAAQVRNLNAQSAAGGGDRPEAVDAALQNAINEHEWEADSVKLMFIVLDAPPHHNQTTVPAMSRLAMEAAEKGIRIIPLLASDGCTETEFLMRTLAITTGGTYTFVTGHSGVSTGRHVEPTIGEYDVEKLNELLIKIINRYLT